MIMKEMEVNGVKVGIDTEAQLQLLDKPVYTLLRVGDRCLVDDGGVVRKGIVKNIMRLSSGKTLFSVDMPDNVLDDWGLFEGDKVSPPDATQCLLRLTVFEMLLRKYEPKGQSTNVSLYGYER